MVIKLLSKNLINQIAAGEVIERPSSVIKELMENAIDANATHIEVRISNAGKSLISVSDNGHGMDKKSIEMCILSHATSKLSSDNLLEIPTFGFRGEALPSIASIARLSIASSNDIEAWSLELEGENIIKFSPVKKSRGTTVIVRDLFFATPARLKFLKSDTSESEHCFAVFNKIAMAFPKISFTFFNDEKRRAHYEKTDFIQQRLRDIFGTSFVENTFEINTSNDGVKLYGFAGVPTYSKASPNHQFFFVNNRCVRDKLLASALKSAYSGLIPQGRYAAGVLYLSIPYKTVDVNAHPAKTEIRFRDPERIRFIVMSEIKKALSSFGAIKPTTEAVNNFCAPKQFNNSTSFGIALSQTKQSYFDGLKTYLPKDQTTSNTNKNIFSISSIKTNTNASEPISNEKLPSSIQQSVIEGAPKINFGEALYQIDNTYIVSAYDNELFIIDQHAVAERITLEKLKNNIKLDSQYLLLPEICSLNHEKVELFENKRELLLRFGIHFEKFSNDQINVTAIPAILKNCNIKQVISDISDELVTFNDTFTINDMIHHVLSTISCHSSLRAGRKLNLQEMNSLLRQMESTANIAQCCHGRPSYIILSMKNLNNFFERS